MKYNVGVGHYLKLSNIYKSVAVSVLFISMFLLFLCCKVASDVSTPSNSPSNLPTPDTPSKLVQRVASDAAAIEWTRDKSVYGDKPVDVYMVRMNVEKTGHRTDTNMGVIKADDLRYLKSLELDGVPASFPDANGTNSNNHSSNRWLADGPNFSYGGDGNLDTLKHKFDHGAHPTEKKRQLTKADFDKATDGDSVRRRMFTLNGTSRAATKEMYVFEKPFDAVAWGDHCVVWLPASDFASHKTLHPISNLSATKNDNLVTTSEGTNTRSIITNEHCKSIVEKFELMYPYLTAMFGGKSKYILYPDGSTMDIEYFTDLANFTNIFVYDLSVGGSSGAVGFFIPTDYAPKFEYITYSDVVHLQKEEAIYSERQPDLAMEYSIYMQSAITNMCNMLHINSTNALENGQISADCLITIAHEYMHSLQFARKVIEGHQPLYGYEWSYAFGEMLGCMCEDVMGDILNVPPESSVIHTRLSAFMGGTYNEVGLLDYVQDQNGASYANVTALGVFLTRNFGGPRLLSEMVKNKYDGWNAIINAVQTVAGKTYTKEGLVRDFCESILCKNSQFNTNKKSASLNVNGQPFVMNEVNFFDMRRYFPDEDESESWLYGINVFKKPSDKENFNGFFSVPNNLRPDGGIHICLVAKNTTANKIRAVFENTSHDPDEIIYIIVSEARN